ncbi:hypothetical protein N7462_000401 [Penicillium macrosclerotiorum]|uniref:uncharacterized protein n=1 Tax=Penicillium macrosclerotiorum TaxID=303699 RepID=UPI002549392B|nr:uncharacterized protein N7462_000401 [Penicillium macrosclerotiorum]KAJ5698396.1 hypothetical protein N7462_000401 [Penicillium macrosclerotiorum]
MDSQREPITPNITQPSEVSLTLDLGIRSDRAKSHDHVSPLAESTAAGTGARLTRYSSAPSPIESPIQSPPPLENCQDWLPLQSPPSKQFTTGLANSSDPSSSTQRFDSQDLGEQRSVQEIPLTFAIDVSGSTAGRILRQEQNAILAVASNSKSQDLVSRSTVLPWSHRSYPPRSIAGVESLTSGGGTYPGTLLGDPACKSRLQDSSLWFLLTDGFIEEPLVQKFANAIPEAGIHGTACVIILFGYALASPFDCNVSVGMAVFAVAPHCIFLFHDVRTAVVYVLQAKGCFANMLPEDKRFSLFGKWTTWENLVTITYEDLSNVRVPAPTKLARDTVLLPLGRQFDLQDIYNDTVSEADKLTLLSDYSALDVVLLAARTRGKGEQVKEWISKSRSTTDSKDPIFLQRDDKGSVAKNTLLTLLDRVVNPEMLESQPDILWQTLYASNEFSAVLPIKSKLRKLHSNNWNQFGLKIEVECDLPEKMNAVFDDVLTTMNNLDKCSISPSLLTPMTSPVPRGPLSKSDGGSVNVCKRSSPLSPRNYLPSASKSENSPAHSTFNPITNELLFLPGYKGNRTIDMHTYSPNYRTCPICGQRNSIQCLLLQTTREPDNTVHFPQINSGARHKYPMVLGNYPETDIIIPLTACDACAFILLQVGELPNGERVDAALPLVSLREENNRCQWLQTISKVYQHRFHENITLLVFLSSLCCGIEDIVDTESSCPSLLECLQWCCEEVSGLPGVPKTAGITPIGSPMFDFIDDSVSLKDALVLAFCDSEKLIQQLPFLAYPIEGFVAIVRLASQIEDIEPCRIELFTWKRLLYHLCEQHLALRQQIGPQQADKKLQEILFEPSIPSLSSESSVTTSADNSPILSISVAILADTYLLSWSSGVGIQFQRMGNYFRPIETTTHYHAALAVFLHTMLDVSTDCEDSSVDTEDFFTSLQQRADGVRRTIGDTYNVFEEAKLVGGCNVARLIEEVYKSGSFF